MPLTRNQVDIAVGDANEVVLEAKPFNWPRSNWELLEVVGDQETGWKYLTDANVTKLRALYNGAHGTVDRGLKGLIVQYVEGTGRASFTITDWRGNTGLYVFVPDTGLELQEIHGAADDGIGRFTATMRFVKVG